MNKAYWTGHTGLEKGNNLVKSLKNLRQGYSLWFRATDGNPDKEKKTENRYANLYAKDVSNILQKHWSTRHSLKKWLNVKKTRLSV